MITTAELAWVAGIVEGEGWLGIRPDKQPGLVVGMTDRDVIERLAGFLGCKVRRKEPTGRAKKVQYIALITGPNAAGWIATLYHFLHARRRERARLVLTTWKQSPQACRYRTHCPRGHAYAGGNVRRNRRGGRVCRACEQAKSNVWMKAHPEWKRKYYANWRRAQRLAAGQLGLAV